MHPYKSQQSSKLNKQPHTPSIAYSNNRTDTQQWSSSHHRSINSSPIDPIVFTWVAVFQRNSNLTALVIHLYLQQRDYIEVWRTEPDTMDEGQIDASRYKLAAPWYRTLFIKLTQIWVDMKRKIETKLILFIKEQAYLLYVHLEKPPRPKATSRQLRWLPRACYSKVIIIHLIWYYFVIIFS